MKVLNVVILLSFLILANIAYSVDSNLNSRIRCSKIYKSEQVNLVQRKDGYVEVNDILGLWYRKEHTLENLNIDSHIISAYRNKIVISVGEGAGSLLPFLLSEKINAYGVDLIYGHNTADKKLMEFEATYKERLIFGNALDLPFQAGTVDVVLSHQLANNFDNSPKNGPIQSSQTVRFLSEVYRVLKKGGEARVNGVRASAFKQFFEQRINEDLMNLGMINPKYKYRSLETGFHLISDTKINDSKYEFVSHDFEAVPDSIRIDSEGYIYRRDSSGVPELVRNNSLKFPYEVSYQRDGLLVFKK